MSSINKKFNGANRTVGKTHIDRSTSQLFLRLAQKNKHQS